MTDPPPLKVLPDGRGIWVVQRLFNSIIAVGPIGEPFYDDHW